MLSSWLLCLALGWSIAGSPMGSFNGSPAGAKKQASGITPGLAAEIERLQGHRVTITGNGYTIDDVAGDGKPLVGVVERRGEHLFLVALDGSSYRLAGPLARPRIAGPGYKIWALGAIDGQAPTQVLTPRRLGVLAPPAKR